MSMQSFLEIFPPDARQDLLSRNQRREYKRGDIIYRSGEVPHSMYIVERGLIGLTMVGPSSGREYLLRFFKHGQILGHRALFSGEGYHATATVLESSTVLMISKESLFAALERSPQIYKDILAIVARELRHCEEQHVMILENQILPRVAQTVIYLRELYPQHNWTRQEIANFCASTVSTVIKALAELEDLGLIRQDGRSIEILKRDELLALSWQ